MTTKGDTAAVRPRKKLIEVALPLDAINVASAREKSIRHGHPSTLHLWWARRPLAAARAVIFAQMVDDPSEYVDVLLADPATKRKAESALKARRKVWLAATETAEKAARGGIESQATDPGLEPELREVAADLERERLFRIIEELVQWENTTNETVLQKARDEIWASWRRTCAENADHPRAKELFDRNKLPAFHDPFAGGGALPLEAQRLGLEAYASDLNPVAVLINKAMIEIPPKFAGQPPVNPDSRRGNAHLAREWRGAQGLAEDVRYYGKWMRDEAERRIGHLYPKVEVTAEMAMERPDLKPYIGRKLTVIAWLWARTVKSPNPAFRDVDVPLASTFMLSAKNGNEVYVQPVIEGSGYRFTVRMDSAANNPNAKSGTRLARGANFGCLMSGTPINATYIKAEARAGRLGARLMALVVEADRRRFYLPPNQDHEAIARGAQANWKPDVDFFQQALGFRIGNYGMTKWSDLFTNRQLAALTTLSDLIATVRELIGRDAITDNIRTDSASLFGGDHSPSYADAVALYLSFATSKTADRNSTLCVWEQQMDRLRGTFGRPALPMVWDYAETNPFAGAGGDFYGTALSLTEALDNFTGDIIGSAVQADARVQYISNAKVVSTDPPYYDNVGYADLSDFFYVWLRKTLRSTFPNIFATVVVPKDAELVATPDRHGGKDGAECFFLDGMKQAMMRIAENAHPAFPATIYYAFKQSETEGVTGVASTGWETFLEAAIGAGFVITGTWPMRTELGNRMRSLGSNALGSSIILACRNRDTTATDSNRRALVGALKAELPGALAHLQASNIAPVDLAQAAIGPGMAVFTRHRSVLDAEGKPLGVRDALALINEILDDVLAAQEGDFEAETRWALAWFEEFGFTDGAYDMAETLSKAKNTSVHGLADAGILDSSRGKVRLLRPTELADKWDPATDPRNTAWKIAHHLVRVLESGGDRPAATLVTKLGAKAEAARELAYRLYTICERKKRAAEALSYNALVQSWPEIMRLAREEAKTEPAQDALFADR